MNEYGYVDPTDTASYSLADFPPLEADRAPIPLVENGRLVYLPRTPDAGLRTTTLGPEPLPEWGIYRLMRDTTPAPGNPVYYIPSHTYAFRNATNTGPGVVGDPTSILQETVTYDQIPIATLFDIKRSEIRAQDQTVRYNAVDTALNANWWLIATQDARNELNGIQGNWLQRQIDGQGFPSGPNAPWVGVFNANTDDSRRVQVTDAATWNTLYLELTQHDQATGNATDASREALDVAYDDGLGDWQAAADHDAADPAWGYPPTVVLSL